MIDDEKKVIAILYCTVLRRSGLETGSNGVAEMVKTSQRLEFIQNCILLRTTLNTLCQRLSSYLERQKA